MEKSNVVVHERDCQKVEEHNIEISWMMKPNTIKGGQYSSMCSTVLAGGAVIDTHTHSGEQIIYVVYGNGEVRIGEDVFPFCTGNLIFIPENTTHKIVNQMYTKMKLIHFFAPAQDSSDIL